MEAETLQQQHCLPDNENDCPHLILRRRRWCRSLLCGTFHCCHPFFICVKCWHICGLIWVGDLQQLAGCFRDTCIAKSNSCMLDSTTIYTCHCSGRVIEPHPHAGLDGTLQKCMPTRDIATCMYMCCAVPSAILYKDVSAPLPCKQQSVTKSHNNRTCTEQTAAITADQSTKGSTFQIVQSDILGC